MCRCFDEDGTLYAGDSVGVRVAPARFVLAPTPPPDIDLEAWEETLRETERRGPARLALNHFVGRRRGGPPCPHARDAHAGSERVAHGIDEATFVAAGRADCVASDPEDAQAYDYAAPYSQCFLGLERYWRKRREHS